MKYQCNPMKRVYQFAPDDRGRFQISEHRRQAMKEQIIRLKDKNKENENQVDQKIDEKKPKNSNKEKDPKEVIKNKDVKEEENNNKIKNSTK